MSSIPRRRKPKPMGCKEPTVYRSDGYRAWVRGHVCLVFSADCTGPMVAAHIRIGTDGGTGFKPSDWWTLPLCDGHHKEQHEGERSFYVKYKLDPKPIALALWRRSSHRHKSEIQP
jgi:hypothetical protein